MSVIKFKRCNYQKDQFLQRNLENFENTKFKQIFGHNDTFTQFFMQYWMKD